MDTVTVSFEVPLPPFESSAEQLLNEQVELYVKQFRGILSVYKDAGIPVPTLSFRATKKKESAEVNEYKEFGMKLMAHHLKFMPKDNSVAQRTVIKQLYGLGIEADELIKLYDESKAEYPMTTWLTVKYKLNKTNTVESAQKHELSQEEREKIIARYQLASEGKV